jgi:large subunit ribosomal protein L18
MKKKIRNDKMRRWKSRRSRVATSMARDPKPRLTVFRSSKHIYAQLVDADGKTLATASTRSKDLAGGGATGNVEAAKRVGTAIAKLAQDKDIATVVFNRNGFLYHGRIKALAEAAREAGLQF